MSIIKSSILPPAVEKALKEEGIENITIGSVWISFDSYSMYVRRVTGFEVTKKYSYDKKEEVYIIYQEAKDWEATEWKKENNKSLHDWKQYAGIKIDKPFSEYRQESLKLINGELLISDFEDKDSDNISSETAVMAKNSKETLTALQVNLEEKRKRVEIVKQFVSYEMEKRKRELEKIKDKLHGVLEVFEKKIKKIMRVITVIELYLGIDEELFQLQEGTPATAETPISFRQMVLFIDEETAEDEILGKVEDGGLDYTNINLFDEYLLKNENYKKLIPEEKGIIVFKPRRQDKDYGDGDRESSAIKNANNKFTSYFLIRNGENLYRIFTEKIFIWERLFPQRKELQKLFDDTSKILEENKWGGDKEKVKEKLEDAFYYYKKQVVFLQGLIDRSSVFHPLPMSGLSVFKMEDKENAKYFNFIYDDEAALPSGRLPFKEWAKKERSKITHGSRIVLSSDLYRPEGYGYNGKYLTKEDNRLFKYYNNEYNIPDAPHTGIYEVENYKEYDSTTQRKLKKEYKKEELRTVNEYKKKGWELIEETEYKYIWKKFIAEHLTISYNPGGEVALNWGQEYRERKNRLKFKIKKDDAFILNYDQISLEDIEFYLYNRTDRKNYLIMIPFLRTLKKWRLKEIENEKTFALMVVGQLIQKYKNLSEEVITAKVWELIEWWKFKNKIKRPINKDDTKALRMIVKRFKHTK